MGDAREIPEKPFYKIAEVCQYTDTQPYVIRFWESEFPQLAPQKARSGQRVYRREDIDLILRIKTLLYEEEYTIAGARRRLEEGPEAGPDGLAAERERGAPVVDVPFPPEDDESVGRAAPEPPDSAPQEIDTAESLRARLAAAEAALRRSEARVEELLGEIERLEGERDPARSDLDQARVVAAEAAREAAERALRIQRSKALEVADMLEEIVSRIEEIEAGPGEESSPAS